MLIRILVILFLFVAGAQARQADTDSVFIDSDTSYAHRIELAKRWLIKLGVEDQLKLFFDQGIQSELNAFEMITDEAERARTKIVPILYEELDRIIPQGVESLATPFAKAFTAEELLECMNSKSAKPEPGPLRDKFDANMIPLRESFEQAGRELGELLWKNAMDRLTPAEAEALEKGVRKKE